jgi:aryl carrier-like protein
MNEFLERVASLPEDKRRLLNLLLRQEQSERPGLSEPYVAPRNEKEQLMCEIWGRVLGVDRVGVNDNFMELGGDSILAIQVMAIARESGLIITSGQFYATPTVASLVITLEQ